MTAHFVFKDTRGTLVAAPDRGTLAPLVEEAQRSSAGWSVIECDCEGFRSCRHVGETYSSKGYMQEVQGLLSLALSVVDSAASARNHGRHGTYVEKMALLVQLTCDIGGYSDRLAESFEVLS